MKKEDLVRIINRLRDYASPEGADSVECQGCGNKIVGGPIEHKEDCDWVQLLQDIEEAQRDG